MKEFFYFTMLAFFITHELDAVLQKEWRVLPLTAFLPEQTARQIFIWAHIPLFILIFMAGGTDANSTIAQAFSIFAIIHIGLHWVNRQHPEYRFHNISSNIIIKGAGLFGLLHLIA